MIFFLFPVTCLVVAGATEQAAEKEHIVTIKGPQLNGGVISHGSGARRLLRGDFTLPAWSTDGRYIAVAERKDGGRRWDVSLVHLPDEFRR